MAPPPVRQALFLSFQVSLPGSPGAGMTKVFHCTSPVFGSSDAIQSRTPLSPPERADDDRVLERERRRGDLEVGLVEQVLVPHDLAGLLVGRDHAPVEAGRPR